MLSMFYLRYFWLINSGLPFATYLENHSGIPPRHLGNLPVISSGIPPWDPSEIFPKMPSKNLLGSPFETLICRKLSCRFFYEFREWTPEEFPEEFPGDSQGKHLKDPSRDYRSTEALLEKFPVRFPPGRNSWRIPGSPGWFPKETTGWSPKKLLRNSWKHLFEASPKRFWKTPRRIF